MDDNNFKPIETKYNGNRFRSRLEARWAVFFNYLKVKYEYEYEGFEIDGIRYLPDFWLPEQDSWLEIKGKEPTHDEKLKAMLLAKGSRKNVFMSIGSPWLQTLDLDIDDIHEKYKKSEYRIMGFFGDHTNIKSPVLKDFHIERFRLLADFLAERKNEGYKFSHPIPSFEISESVISLLIDLDCEYYMQKHGKPHPTYEYRDKDEKILWAIIDDKLLPEVFTAILEKEFIHPKLLGAYNTARGARFEHGESPDVE